MSDIGWGILGAGKIASTFVADIQGGGLRVAAVGAREHSRAAQFAQQFGITTAHGNYQELVTDPGVDVVYVATPQAFHAEHALLSIAAGKAVLVEKSFTVTVTEAERVIAAAREAGVFAMEAMWTRFTPAMVAVRERIAEGGIGDVVEVHANLHQKVSSDPDGRHYDPAMGGGALLDMGVYPVSLAIEMLGTPTRIETIGRTTTRRVDTRASATMDFPTGIATASCAMDLPGPVRASIIGTEGFIDFDPWWFTGVGWSRWDAARPGNLVERWEPPSITGRGMHYQALEVERCLRAGLTQSPVMPWDQTITVMAAVGQMLSQLDAVGGDAR